jgi:beta-glucosidase
MVKILLFFFLVTIGFSTVLPKDFAWGSATAAFQVEGAWNVSGRGQCIWDYFQSFPGRIYNNETAQVADDFYDRYPSDIGLMTQLGIKNFRLSFSWTRLLPNGNPSNVSAAGVQFYHNLIDALLAAGIEPYVTLFHWDLPQTFNNFTNTSTWLDPDVPNKFNRYADFCFNEFGSKVKYWLTMNEIQTFTWIGYGVGTHAPGRCSPDWGSWCQQIGGGGNSSTEPYIAAHNALLAHGLAVQTYRVKYQKTQKGKIGMTISSGFSLPSNTSRQADVKAVDTAVAFQYGWFADPQVFGQYPPEMTSVITGNRLPSFNATTSALLKGSYDFLGLNYYASSYVNYTGIVGSNFGNDGRFSSSPYNATGNLIGPFADSTWLNVYAPGLRGILNWIRKRYGNPPVYIFENGVSCPNESSIPESQALQDNFRMNYIYNHVMNMVDAVVNEGCDVRGYFYWSLLDNFEWTDGYNVRFGLTYVNYDQNLTRTIKDSGYLYQSLIGYLGATDAVDKNLSPLFHLLRAKSAHE